MSRVTVATDSFTRANGPVGANWGYLRDIAWNSNTPKILGNRIISANAQGSHYQIIRWVGTEIVTQINDQYASIVIGDMTFNDASYFIGVALRVGAGTDAGASFYAYKICSDNPNGSTRTSVLFKFAGGTETIIDTRSNVVWANGDVLLVEVTGNAPATINVYQNGTLVFSITDTGPTAGKTGVCCAGDNSTVSATGTNWEGGNLSAPAGPTMPIFLNIQRQMGE